MAWVLGKQTAALLRVLEECHLSVNAELSNTSGVF